MQHLQKTTIQVRRSEFWNVESTTLTSLVVQLYLAFCYKSSMLTPCCKYDVSDPRHQLMTT